MGQVQFSFVPFRFTVLEAGKGRTMQVKDLWRNIITTVLIMSLSTLVAVAFFYYGKNTTSVAIIYVLSVMLVARYTVGYASGIVASLFGVGFVNYVFTYPYMTLNFTIDGYPVTFVGMTVVSVITSAMTTKFKKQSQMLNEREKLLMEAEKETMRANLLRAVSHDLRTPLTAIIGLASTYLENGTYMKEAERTELVSNIREDANWLLNMVENLLSVTRIHVGDARVAKSMEPLEDAKGEPVYQRNIHVDRHHPQNHQYEPIPPAQIPQPLFRRRPNRLSTEYITRLKAENIYFAFLPSPPSLLT